MSSSRKFMRIHLLLAKIWREWRLITIAMVALVFLEGCDVMYGPPGRRAELEQMPDLGCIREAIGLLPGVNEVQYYESDDQQVLDSKGLHVTKAYSFAYHSGTYFLGALSVDRTSKDQYSLKIYRFSFERLDPADVDKIETGMDSLSTILAERCGINVIAATH